MYLYKALLPVKSFLKMFHFHSTIFYTANKFDYLQKVTKLYLSANFCCLLQIIRTPNNLSLFQFPTKALLSLGRLRSNDTERLSYNCDIGFQWVPQHHLNQDNSKNKLNVVFFFTKRNLEVYFIRNNISPEGEKN